MWCRNYRTSPSIHDLLGLVEILFCPSVLCRNCKSPPPLVALATAHVVVLVFQIASQTLHYVCAQPYFTVLLSSRVDLEPAEIAVGTIPQYPHFDPTLDWLHWHVLLQSRAPLKRDHGLVHCNVLRWIIKRAELAA